MRAIALADILDATEQFAANRRLGSGGYGVVYRGSPTADHDSSDLEALEWAVKRAKTISRAGPRGFPE